LAVAVAVFAVMLTHQSEGAGLIFGRYSASYVALLAVVVLTAGIAGVGVARGSVRLPSVPSWAFWVALGALGVGIVVFWRLPITNFLPTTGLFRAYVAGLMLCAGAIVAMCAPEWQDEA
jgi:predicted membrane channel-forming protein YqfA (hemolysin III family)